MELLRCCLVSVVSLLIVNVFLVIVTEARSRGLPNICLQPPPRSEGVCTIEIEGFYFDPRISMSDCQMYIIGGCRSSRGQSFGNRQDCLDTCVHGTRRIQDLRINE